MAAHLRRTATLRDIAALIQHASPNISAPQQLHAFRLCYFDSRRGSWVSRGAGEGVTRVSPESFEELLPSHKRPEGLDERSASRTLEDLQVVEGDLLDVVVLPDPSAPPPLNAAGPAGLSIRGRGAPPRGTLDVPSAALGAAHPWGPGGRAQPDRDFPPRSGGNGALAGRMDGRRPPRDGPQFPRDRADQGWGARAAPREDNRGGSRGGAREEMCGDGGYGARRGGGGSGWGANKDSGGGSGWGAKDSDKNGNGGAGAWVDDKGKDNNAAGWGDDAGDQGTGTAAEASSGRRAREEREGRKSSVNRDRSRSPAADGWA